LRSGSPTLGVSAPEKSYERPANFNGQKPIIDADDAVMLLIDRQNCGNKNDNWIWRAVNANA
jgi:hypothetical protein